VTTTAVFFPFDLFGSAGCSGGASLLADAFQEMLADNRRERTATRAKAYQDQVRSRHVRFETLTDYRDWRARGRRVVREVFRKEQFLLWIAGNHLGVLPVYEELARHAADTIVVQLDAHLDVQNFTDCTSELSHGNFLLHAERPLPAIINVGHRDLLMEPAHVGKFYERAISADTFIRDEEASLKYLRQRAERAKRVFLDIDCDVLDPAFFPAVTHPEPFGLSSSTLLKVLTAVWSECLIGVALSEFDPGRDSNDRSLATLAWLIEYLLLRRYECR
jgi:arginase family enzyme